MIRDPKAILRLIDSGMWSDAQSRNLVANYADALDEVERWKESSRLLDKHNEMGKRIAKDFEERWRRAEAALAMISDPEEDHTERDIKRIVQAYFEQAYAPAEAEHGSES